LITQAVLIVVGSIGLINSDTIFKQTFHV
jgi:hypothetical protein